MKVLVANRGEIAVRIIRACRELGMESVAIYSEVDRSARHVRLADEAVCVGPAKAADSYMNIDAVIAAALESGTDAVHPGYGFLSENEEFAAAVEDAGLIFIGPRSEVIAKMGNKLTARQVAEETGLPVLKGLDVELSRSDEMRQLCSEMKFPILVKAVAGGGGRGIRVANNLAEIEQVVAAASEEAAAVFGNDCVYLEPLVQSARHIEVQILGDGKGKVLVLGERECSIQRRRQKLIEEAPAPGLSETLRQQIHQAAQQLGMALNYRSLGTVEFLLDPDGDFYFIEVNPRIQVEHPVTELVTGIDLVVEQLKLADTGELNLNQEDVIIRGSAMEARIIAEIPELGFLPDTGTIHYLNEPSGPGVRVDSAMFEGMAVGSDYDSMLGKLIVWGADRAAAVRRMRCALQEFQISGVQTDVPFLLQIVQSASFIEGQFDTTYLDQHQSSLVNQSKCEWGKMVALVLAKLTHEGWLSEKPKTAGQRSEGSSTYNPWRMAALQEQVR
ncbi:MAG: acetyl-CoA carboxylase biotin carboxylase subunit [Anaerolineaceae bacterium]|nr:acetyl-CoA carboxylase biotin carboxylase subunit [Anaerolineaceae bacterium]